MKKIDLKKSFKDLFEAPVGEFKPVEVPTLQFVKIDGHGDPNTGQDFKNAVEWLYAISYAMKFAAKALAKDYVVPPLEGLWWADDPESFIKRRKADWRWTLMLMAPSFVDRSMYEAALEKARKKLGSAPASLRFEPYSEGLCLQTLHIGSYDDEGPILAKLHHEIMPAQGLVHNGAHHEIYLSDARKMEPGKLKTILRQPVRPRAD